jgi:hypothetical protein
LKPDHPWSFSGKTAELLQLAVESIDPIKATEWCSAAITTFLLSTRADLPDRCQRTGLSKGLNH